MSTWQSAELHFAPDHPVAAGHFPGNPIIPGALLLDAALATIVENAVLMTERPLPRSLNQAGQESSTVLMTERPLPRSLNQAGQKPVKILTTKFLHIVRPGAHIVLRWRSSGPGLVKFECHLAGGELAMTGTLEVGS